MISGNVKVETKIHRFLVIHGWRARMMRDKIKEDSFLWNRFSGCNKICYMQSERYNIYIA